MATGVHVRPFKDLTRDRPIEDLPAPAEAVILLVQHAGAPAAPTVRKGDAVAEGQVVGEADGFVSARIHSSVSGTVAAVERRIGPNGRRAPAVVVTTDPAAPTAPPPAAGRDWRSMDRAAVVAAVREAGVVGMGGAAFPTSVKLSPPPGRTIGTVVLNACECEPYLTCDYRVLLESPAKALEGLALMRRASGAARAVVAVEGRKKALVEALRRAAAGDARAEIATLPERYPQGSEKHLIARVLGREVPPGKLPADVGCLVFNVQTACAVRDAVVDGVPVTRRVMTVAGLVERPGNYRVRIGTKISDVLAACGGNAAGGARLVIGGPMMGANVPDPSVPVVKGTSGILLLPERPGRRPEQPCLRCGRCVAACPMRLLPTEIARAARRSDWQSCGGLWVGDCIECGCCTYACPAGLPLVELMKWAKNELRAKK